MTKEKVYKILVEVAAQGKTIRFYPLLRKLGLSPSSALELKLIDVLYAIGNECRKKGEPCIVYIVSRNGDRMYKGFFTHFEGFDVKTSIDSIERAQKVFYDKVLQQIFDYWLPKSKVESIARIMV